MWEKYLLRPTQGTVSATVPVFVYGTAWKEDRTADLVYDAIKAGFRAVDSAAQPRHYQEHLVGDGIRQAIADGIVERKDLYVSQATSMSLLNSQSADCSQVQSKFIPVSAQDPDNMPYDPFMPITEQVLASVHSSRENLRSADNPSIMETCIDTVIIHLPLPSLDETIEVWHALETFVPHIIRNIGVSNCDLSTLRFLCNSDEITVKPCVVQNKFYEETHFDVPLRAFCRENQVIYQSFWTLTANPQLLASAPVQQLAKHLNNTPEAALYVLVMGLKDVVVLNGTTNVEHMEGDLASPEQVEEFTQKQPELWCEILSEFRRLIGEPDT